MMCLLFAQKGDILIMNISLNDYKMALLHHYVCSLMFNVEALHCLPSASSPFDVRVALITTTGHCYIANSSLEVTESLIFGVAFTPGVVVVSSK